MKQCTTADRLKQIMDERGLRQIDIVNAAAPCAKQYGIKFGKSF